MQKGVAIRSKGPFAVNVICARSWITRDTLSITDKRLSIFVAIPGKLIDHLERYPPVLFPGSRNIFSIRRCFFFKRTAFAESFR